MIGKLTTHVLDTARGCPAVGLAIELWKIDPALHSRTLLVQTTTNLDGRTQEPLLSQEAFQIGVYELVFDVGAYFLQSCSDLPEPAFLSSVPIRFGIADLSVHYHVPLLVSPWSYSTYRGS